MAQVRYTRNLFLRGICIIYLFAFLSFYIQIPGLYGDNGILPARTHVNLKTRATLFNKLKQKPTFLWFAPYLGLNVEYMLDVLSLLGVILSFAGFVSQRVCIAPVFAGLWSLYFSLHQIGQIFSLFQWDALLLEVGFLCILIAPFWYSHRGKSSTPSDAVTFWTVRWLLFRLIFSNGVIKLISKSPLWWKLDALNFYFESQYIPTPLAWYAHHLPTWFLRLSTIALIFIEFAIPFLFFFLNRKVRIIAFYLQVFLQICMIATGNYNFYNYLTICLCISLLDDQFFYKRKSKNDKSRIINYLSTLITVLVYGGIVYGAYIYYHRITNGTNQSDIAITKKQFDSLLPRVISFSICVGIASLGLTAADSIANAATTTKGMRNKITTTIVTIFYTIAVCLIFALSLVPYSTLHTSTILSENSTISIQLKQMHAKVDHLHLVNDHGLLRFTVEDLGRREIIMEGSDSIDGPWKEYEFLYKPGNVNNSLPFVAPYQPRLDWQMWFAALVPHKQNTWLLSLTYRLLTGQPEVLALINTVESPFRDRPPKYIRAYLYYYHFTPWNQINTNAWWTREKKWEYFQIFSQNHPEFIDHLKKMKIIQDASDFKIANEPLKLILDNLRFLVGKIEASLFLWGVFTAGCTVIVTSYSNSISKKK